MQAFARLSSGRASLSPPSRIAWRDIVAYGEYYGMDYQGVEALTIVIAAMDDAFLEWMSAQQEAQPSKTPRK